MIAWGVRHHLFLIHITGSAGPSGYGSRTTAEQVARDCLRSITNSAHGHSHRGDIGAETARVLPKVIPARDLIKAIRVKQSIERESPEAEIFLLEIDLSSFHSIHTFCSHFLSLGLPLHILIYNGTRAYAQSKVANILHAKELARQLKARKANVTINAVHPGIVKTGIIRDYKGFITDSFYFMASKLLKSTSQGAATTCYVALSPHTADISGKYFADCNDTQCSPLANDDFEARKLWKQTHAFIRRRFHLNVEGSDAKLETIASC